MTERTADEQEPPAVPSHDGAKSGTGRMIGASKYRKPQLQARPKSLTTKQGGVFAFGDGKGFDSKKKELINELRELSDGADLIQAIEERKSPKFEKPTMPTKWIKKTVGVGDAAMEVDVEVDCVETDLSFIDKSIKLEEVKVFMRKITNYTKNSSHLFKLITQDCTVEVLAKLEGEKDFVELRKKNNGRRLLDMLEEVLLKVNDGKYVHLGITMAKKKVYTIFQHNNESVAEFYARFKAAVEAANFAGAEFGHDLKLVNTYYKKITEDEDADVRKVNLSDVDERAKVVGAEEASREAELACIFLMEPNRNRYGLLQEDLMNDGALGNDTWPKTLSRAYQYSQDWTFDPRNHSGPTVNGPANDGLSFNTIGNDGGRKKRICFKCGQEGHFQWQKDRCTQHPDYKKKEDDCKRRKTATTERVSDVTKATVVPKKFSFETEKEEADLPECAKDGIVAVGEYELSLDEFEASMCSIEEECCLRHVEREECWTFHLGADGTLPHNWILLDTQSTTHVFFNPDLLHNVTKGTGRLRIHSMGGVSVTQEAGDFGQIQEVWLQRNGIANILSFAKVSDVYDVHYDPKKDAFVVGDKATHRTIFEFVRSARGLYYCDIGQRDNQDGFSLLSTVEENRAKFSARDNRRADEARKLQRPVERPSVRDFIKMVEEGPLRDSPVTRRDVMIAEAIFGPDEGILQGKTAERKGPAIRVESASIPPQVMQYYRNVVISADIMKVNGVAFFMSISRHLLFGTAERIANNKDRTLQQSLFQIRRLYMLRGFRVVTFIMDGQFESVRGYVEGDLQCRCELVGRGVHAPEVERYIRTVKDRVRCVYTTLKFASVPICMLIELVYYANF